MDSFGEQLFAGAAFSEYQYIKSCFHHLHRLCHGGLDCGAFADDVFKQLAAFKLFFEHFLPETAGRSPEAHCA